MAKNVFFYSKFMLKYLSVKQTGNIYKKICMYEKPLKYVSI